MRRSTALPLLINIAIKKDNPPLLRLPRPRRKPEAMLRPPRYNQKLRLQRRDRKTGTWSDSQAVCIQKMGKDLPKQDWMELKFLFWIPWDWTISFRIPSNFI
ncbi:uncharacterized protein LOC143907650 [Temnothorax americanus]|uniref:uncharacterized protein LOC143907650 n=1 Tax=Temnothorax americanus TaxID=1964332 RepID=UPI004067C789